MLANDVDEGMKKLEEKKKREEEEVKKREYFLVGFFMKYTFFANPSWDIFCSYFGDFWWLLISS